MNLIKELAPPSQALPAKLGVTKPGTEDGGLTARVAMSAPQSIAPELLLDVFDAPIVFHRILVDVTGSVTAALMLSQMLAVDQDLPIEAHGWFERSIDAWQVETGLSRFEQASARKVLRELGVLDELRVGAPPKLMYRLNHSVLWKATQEASARKWARRRAVPRNNLGSQFAS